MPCGWPARCGSERGLEVRSLLAALVLTAGVAAAPPASAGAATAAPPPALPAGEIVDPVPCTAAPDQSYALYLPRDYTPARRWGVLYAFDARQRGRLVAELYRGAAERLGVIVVSSNNSRSDEAVDPNLPAMKAMWEDSHARFAIDPARVYATGFSGGARIACLLAFVRPGEVAGVIGAGGGFPHMVQPARDLRFAFFGLAGTRDFNYPELRNLDRTLGELGITHAFDSFEGDHEWPPPRSAERALAWLELLGMRRGTVAKRAGLIDEEWRAALERARWLEAGDPAAGVPAAGVPADPVAAHRLLRETVEWFGGLRETSTAGAELARVAGSEAYRRELEIQNGAEADHTAYVEAARTTLASLLAEEPETVNVKRALNLLDVPRLRREAAEHPAPYARNAAARSLEALFVQVGFYVPRAYSERGDPARAALCLAIAVEIHPDSADTWYSLARARALSGEKRGALAALKQAFATGFDDRPRLATDDAFARLRGDKAFQALLAGRS